MTGILRIKRWRHGRKPCEDRDTDYSYAAQQGPLKPLEAGMDSPWSLQREEALLT